MSAGARQARVDLAKSQITVSLHLNGYFLTTSGSIMNKLQLLLLSILTATSTLARDPPTWRKKLSRLLQSDFPYTKAAIRATFPRNNVANKGMAIIVGREAFMRFDTDLLR